MDLSQFHALSIQRKNSFNTVLAADTTIPPQLRGLQERTRMLARGIGEATAKSILLAIALRWAEVDGDKQKTGGG